MTATAETKALLDRFSKQYRETQTALIQRIERSVFGCAYGTTSWTTRDEADRVGKKLALGPGKRLLDVGTGCGWPGLYLAKITGCDVALLDLPFEGLRNAARRAVSDHIADRCWPVMADGASIPFRSGLFDAIFHSDVLCCLDAKRAVLVECRRVIGESGTMIFSVIAVAPGLSGRDHERAVEFGPAFIDSKLDYPTMLREAAWKITDRVDLSAGFLGTVRALLQQEERHADELIALRGEQSSSERVETIRSRLRGLELGLIRRDLYTATPVSS